MHSLYILSKEKDYFRIPLCSFEDLKTSFALTEEELEKKIIDLCNNSFFMEAVFVASPSLYNDLCKLRNGEITRTKKRNEVILSSCQYFYRMCSRTTSFGLFAAITKNKENISPQKKIKKTLLLDFEWSWRFSKELENDFLEMLCFQKNGICYEMNNNYCVPYSISDYGSTVAKTKLTYSILQACKNSISFKDIQKEICERQKISDIIQFQNEFHNLLNTGIIISNLTPTPCQQDYLGFLLESLGDNFSQSEKGQIVKKIRERIKIYENNQCEEPIAVLSKITSDLSDLLSAKRYIQIDASLIDGINFSVSQESREEICDAINLIFEFFSKVKDSHSIYDTYKDLFLNKYGDYRTVPILEMLDPYMGIGVPNTYNTHIKKSKGEKEYPTHYNQKLVRYVYSRIQKAIQEKTSVIIDEEFISLLSSIKHSEIEFPQNVFSGVFCSHDRMNTPKFEINMDLFPTSGELLPLQRFMDFQQTHHMENYKIETSNEDTPVCCQLQYIPKRLKWANIMREMSSEQRHIKGYIWDDAPQQSVDLNNLYVGLENNRFFLLDSKSNKRVKVLFKNMYSYNNDSDVVRFLKEVGEDNLVQIKSELFDNYFSLHVYLPEFCYKNITIIPETWRFCENDLLFPIGNFQDFKKWLKQIIIKYKIPDIVYYRIGDFGFFINLKHDLSCKMIYKSWNKYQTLMFQKYCFSSEKFLFSNNETYRVEMLMSLFYKGKEERKNTPALIPNCKDVENRFFLPGTEWIYVKLFGVKNENQIIEHIIVPWCNQQIHKGNATKFFFVRYKEEGYQIRLRIQQSKNGNLFLQTIDWLNSLTKNIIHSYDVSTYERELERYGDERGIVYAEEIFYYDSLMCAKHVNKNIIEKKEIFLHVAMIYLNVMYPNIKERLDWITENSPDRRDYKEYVKKYNVKTNKEIAQICGDQNETITILKNILRDYSNYLNNIYLKARAVDGIIHMSFNRMIGMNRAIEMEMRAVLRYRVFQYYQKCLNSSCNQDELRKMEDN